MTAGTHGERAGVRRARECAAMGHTGPSCERCGREVGDPRETAHRWFDRAKRAYGQADVLAVPHPGEPDPWYDLMAEGDRWSDWAGTLSLLLWRHEAREVFA